MNSRLDVSPGFERRVIRGDGTVKRLALRYSAHACLHKKNLTAGPVMGENGIIYYYLEYNSI